MHNDSTAREGRFSFEPDMQLSFFENHEDDENEMQLEAAMADIRNKYGKNAMLKGFKMCLSSFPQKLGRRDKNIKFVYDYVFCKN